MKNVRSSVAHIQYVLIQLARGAAEVVTIFRIRDLPNPIKDYGGKILPLESTYSSHMALNCM